MIDEATTAAILARLERALAAPTRQLRPLRIGSAVVGWLDPDRAARIAAFSGVFAVSSEGVAFLATLADHDARSAAMTDVTQVLAREGALTQWRDELYAVAPSFGAPPWFHLERAAARYFGVHTWAAHCNGLVQGSPEALMWFARRSEAKAIDPGMLDNLVGGGIAAGMTVSATFTKEAWEEAGIPPELAARALPGGAIHIWREQPDGLQSETIFVNDLWLPDDFVPVNQDGEAIEHRLVTTRAAAQLIAVTEGTDQVTADASLVVLDFLLRQGAIAPGSPSYLELQRLVHRQAAARRA